MQISDENVLAAPCGLYCGLCSEYKAKACPGCRKVEGNCTEIDGICETYICVYKYEIDFCFECSEFPCENLHPAADMASILPHNIKVFNLCYIKEHGLSKWLEKAFEIRQKYFHGKMIIGKGPQME